MHPATSEYPSPKARNRRTNGRRQWEVGVGCWVLTSALAIATACGKKGPPLAPTSRIPAAVEQMTARRVGNDVYLSLVVPAQNIDGSMPGTARRIDVYGYTGLTPPPRGRFLEAATLVATRAVSPPPLAADPVVPSTADAATSVGAVPGSTVQLVDRLEADELVDHPLAPPAPSREGVVGQPAAGPAPANAFLRRFYMAIASSGRAVPGPPSPVVELPLVQLPDPPAAVRAEVGESEVLLGWYPSGGLIGFLTDRELPLESAPFDETGSREDASPQQALPPGPTRFNVYLELAPDPLEQSVASDDALAAAPPVPVNATPLDVLTFSEPLALDERERCYQVRSVRGTPPLVVESEPSQRVCVRPIDVFPPAPPSGLAAIPAEGVITLIWEPNGELDLGGYLVLRGEAGGATLLPLTDTPISETRYTDSAVVPGVTYVYAVAAVDTRVPLPNVSALSETVEELAR